MNLDLETVRKVVPANLKRNISQQVVDRLNRSITDPEIADEVKENFIGYISVMQNGKFKIDSYLSAVKYVSYKLQGDSNVDSYAKTFPNRFQALKAKGYDAEKIGNCVRSYNKTKLVNLIFEQTMVPSWVLNHDVYQKAINAQAYLMTHSESDYVRTQAANSILTHLAKPKEVQPLLNINMGENSGLNELKDMLGELAKKQMDLIGSGASPKDIAEQKLVSTQ